MWKAGRAAPRGTWRQWLQLSRDELRQRVLSDAQARAAGDEAREAITHYEVIAEYHAGRGKEFCSKLRLRLETGRKHQIRVQAAHAGMPLIGDRTYNPAYRARDPAHPPIDFPRQALHAEFLGLEHPGAARSAHELDGRIAQRPSATRNRTALWQNHLIFRRPHQRNPS